MGNVGLGLAAGAEYVEPRGAEPGRAPKPPCAAFVLPHSGHRVKVQKAGHRESTGRGHGYEPELCQDPSRKQTLRRAQDPVLDRCQGLFLIV